MLKNHEFRVRLAKADKKSSTDTEQKPFMTPDEIKNVSEEVLKKAAVTVIAVAGALTAMHTASQILINNTNPANRK